MVRGDEPLEKDDVIELLLADWSVEPPFSDDMIWPSAFLRQERPPRHAEAGVSTENVSAEGEATFPCKICGKRFFWKQNRTTHMRLHTDHRPCKCSTCGKAFKWWSSLKAHRKCCEREERTHRGGEVGLLSKFYKTNHQEGCGTVFPLVSASSQKDGC